MAESTEHRFVTESFVTLTRELSRSQLYGYREADRGRLDFACTLYTSKERQLIGQTLTHHDAGIEKDLNLLILHSEREVPVYIYAHSAKNEARVQEVIERFRYRHADRLELLRLYRYPAEFNADSEAERTTVYSAIRQQIVDDLLLNVLFGRLAGTDIELFLSDARMESMGVPLAILEHIATKGYSGQSDLRRALDNRLSMSTVRRHIQVLISAGMLDVAPQRSYRASQRARIFLKICSMVDVAASNSRRGREDIVEPTITRELTLILERLGLDGTELSAPSEMLDKIKGAEARMDSLPVGRTVMLIGQIFSARSRYNIEVSGGPYPDNPGGWAAAWGSDLHWICR